MWRHAGGVACRMAAPEAKLLIPLEDSHILGLVTVIIDY